MKYRYGFPYCGMQLHHIGSFPTETKSLLAAELAEETKHGTRYRNSLTEHCTTRFSAIKGRQELLHKQTPLKSTGKEDGKHRRRESLLVRAPDS